MMKRFLLVSMMLASVGTLGVMAQQDAPRSGYKFEMIKEAAVSPVKNQQSTGTCWCYATISFLESELIRMGKPVYDLSEMFAVRNAYNEKGLKFVRSYGNNNFSEGGQAHDVIAMVEKYGIVPESVYDGLKYSSDYHIHREMCSAMEGMLKGVNENPNKKMTPVWPLAFGAIIDTYMGAIPERFTYEGKEYTPKSFAQSLGINLNDYVELTSYQLYPFYEAVELDIPDNWSHSRYYNLPLDDFMEVINSALKKGYSVAWDGDVSEKGFSHINGLAILPTNEPTQMVNAEADKWQSLSKEEKANRMYSFVEPVPEMKVDDAGRQESFDNRQSTDDHLMHLTGVLKDQNGTLYYKTKNSWGTERNPFDGYLYMSEPYVKMKTTAIMVHKDAIPQAIRAKLGL